MKIISRDERKDSNKQNVTAQALLTGPDTRLISTEEGWEQLLSFRAISTWDEEGGRTISETEA